MEQSAINRARAGVSSTRHAFQVCGLAFIGICSRTSSRAGPCLTLSRMTLNPAERDDK